jgi:hypothetical protein
MMPLMVDGYISTISVELIGRLHGDFRPGLPRSRAMLIDAACEPDVNSLGILSAY